MMRENEAALFEKFLLFVRENPLGLVKEQFEKIENDIRNPGKGIVCDEYVEFTLWMKGLRSRQEYFAEYVTKLLPLNSYQSMLEVGAGRTGRLSKLLVEKGYRMTAMDPQITPENAASDAINYIKDYFSYGETDITKYDAIVAQEPCEATEHIVRECVAEKKDFVISLCGAAHRLINGEMPEDVYAWYHYLKEIDSDNCILVRPELIPGYASYVLIGKFE